MASPRQPATVGLAEGRTSAGARLRSGQQPGGTPGTRASPSQRANAPKLSRRVPARGSRRATADPRRIASSAADAGHSAASGVPRRLAGPTACWSVPPRARRLLPPPARWANAATDSIAAKPFCLPNFADFTACWLVLRQHGANLPKIFHVNWFHKNADSSSSLMAGFVATTLRVLGGSSNRCKGTTGARHHRILPHRRDLNLDSWISVCSGWIPSSTLTMRGWALNWWRSASTFNDYGARAGRAGRATARRGVRRAAIPASGNWARPLPPPWRARSTSGDQRSPSAPARRTP